MEELKDELLKNPIIESLSKIHAADMIDNFIDCYLLSKDALGENFEELMIGISRDILDLKSKCKKDANIFMVAIALITCDPEDGSDPHIIAISNANIKAATIYILLNKLI